MLFGLLLAAAACAPAAPPRDRAAAERAYRSNNIGVALLEQSRYGDAVQAFREAVAADGTLALVRINLSIALFYNQDLAGARQEAEAAARLAPTALQPPYLLGLIARAENRPDEARAAFVRVHAGDPRDVGARVNLAQLALEARRPQEAVDLLRPVIADEPYHLTAAYVLGLALTRVADGRDRETLRDGQALIERSQALRQTGYAIAFGTGYLEQGRYAEAVAATGAEPELVEQQPGAVTFTWEQIASTSPEVSRPASPFGVRYRAGDLDEAGVRRLVSGLGGGVAVVDIDADVDLDVVTAGESGLRLWKHEGGVWVDATRGSGLERAPAGAVPTGVVSADVDNDGDPDLFVPAIGGGTLWRNDGQGRFADATRAAKLPPYPYLPGAAAFADVDHDGDLDLVIAGLADLAATRRQGRNEGWRFPDEFVPAPLRLLRNNGDGSFADVTEAAALQARTHAVAVAPTDYDNHRDMDLLVVNYDGPPQLWSNQRDGTFREVAADSGLARHFKDGALSVAVGDLNKDDLPDFAFATPTAVVHALSDARGGFAATPIAAARGRSTAVQIFDHDSDGLLDLATWGDDGPRVLRNAGDGWRDVTEQTFASAARVAAGRVIFPRSLVVADLNRDGRQDLIGSGPNAAWQWRSSGDRRHRAMRVDIAGRVSNRDGIGAKIQMRAGSLTARTELSAATPAVAPVDVVFGLGGRGAADAVRVLWPSGILQAELPAAAAADGASAGSTPAGPVTRMTIEELDRKPSSCPFLFAWNGERFEFVTDFLGGGEMGGWFAPGVYNTPDPVEYVRIAGSQLRELDGRFELRLTNELEETLFLDHVELTAVDHPADVSVYPNEGLSDPPKPARLYAVRDLAPPLRAHGDRGTDVLSRIADRDWLAVDDFGLERIRGYAKPHLLHIDIGPRPAPVLLLTGWTDYAFSSDNVAAHQAGLRAEPPVMEVKTVAGAWRRLPVAIGIPVGRPQTIPVDVSKHLRPGERELRVSTNMRVYWDQIQVATLVTADLRQLTIGLRSAELRARGYSAERRAQPLAPLTYDYDRASSRSPWKAAAGWFTRLGDVLPLLMSSDDRFVIARSGDEIALQFSAGALPTPAVSSARTFLLKADGFSKEMDINSASPDAVEPLPFHGMSRYPYPDGEHYPTSPEHEDYRRTFNTRRVIRPLPPLQP